MARIAVGIAAGHHADTLCAGGAVTAAIPHAIARLQLLNADDPLLSVIAGCSPVAATSFQQPLGEAPYRMILWRTQLPWVEGCHSVAAELAAARQRYIGSRRLDSGHLLGYAFRAVGGSEMAHQRKFGDIGNRLRSCHTSRSRSGANPNRFMPLFTFR